MADKEDVSKTYAKASEAKTEVLKDEARAEVKAEAKADAREAKAEAKAVAKAADQAPGFEPSTPSALALAEVGNLDGETVKPDGYEKAAAHGEAYQAAKKKHRWG